MTVDITSETMEDKRKEVEQHFLSAASKELSTQNSISSKNILHEWRLNKDILRGKKIKRMFLPAASRPSLKEMLRKILQIDSKWYQKETWRRRIKEDQSK